MPAARSISIALLSAAAAAVCAIFLLFGSAAEASVTCSKYVSPSGSDSAPGTLTAPFRTPQHLVEALQPGETGCLRQGTYYPTGTYVFSMARGGTSSAPITVTSYPGEHATIRGIVQVPAGDNYVTLSDMTFEGTAGMQTIKIYSTGVHIEDNEITNNWNQGSCMMLGSNSAGQALRPVISGNVFHACGAPADGNKDHGIYAANVYEGQIVGNLFYDSAAYAIQLYPNAQKTIFAHNVIDGSSPSVRGGLVFGGDEEFASSENVVEQNVIAFATTYDIASVWGGEAGRNNIARSNCLYGGGQGQLSNAGGLIASENLTANPQFVDTAADDFRLAAGSPCLSKVGYDTVAAIEAGGVEIPVGERSPEPSPPAEGGTVEEGETAPPLVDNPPATSPLATPPAAGPNGGAEGGSSGTARPAGTSGLGEQQTAPSLSKREGAAKRRKQQARRRQLARKAVRAKARAAQARNRS